VDPENRSWLRSADGRPFFLCGPGDPEDFLYRGRRREDGTRDGDQLALIAKLKPTGANSIYLEAVRSHGGDGDRTQNPFTASDPARGLDPRILDQWEDWFTAMDGAGILIYFIVYDDGARVFDTGDEVGAAEGEFLDELVRRFRRHRLLIWCVAEEYQEALTPLRVSRIARRIRAGDEARHPLAAHKLHGLDFREFAGDPGIDQFAIQYNVPTAAALHAGVVQAFREARGRYNLCLSEAADWGSGAEARKKLWACALGGAYVMVLGMDIARTPVSDLEDCGRLVKFMESASFKKCAPRDELKHAGTEYVLARPPETYLAYAADAGGRLGLKGLTAGWYDLHWFDPRTGASAVSRAVRVTAGDQSWEPPAGIGPEVALWLERAEPAAGPTGPEPGKFGR